MSANVHALSFPQQREPGVVVVKPLDPRGGLPSSASTGGGDDDVSDTPEARAHAAVAEKSAAIAEKARLRRERIRGFVLVVFPPIAGIALLILVWSILTIGPDSRLPSVGAGPSHRNAPGGARPGPSSR